VKIIRKSQDRGHFDFDWLKTWHTFSFGSYFDPQWMGFKSLRVINEDVIAPGEGFPTHPHRDMEIITLVLEGELEHRDTLGHHAIIKPGEIQVMSTGTGIMHSEFNSSSTSQTRMLQIWIRPEKNSLSPQYQQKSFQLKTNQRLKIVSRNGTDETARINQEMGLFLAQYQSDQCIELELEPTKNSWMHVIEGARKRFKSCYFVSNKILVI
jgi:redox-sensitive bicupin YhaK (pirin superfamily)